MIDSNFGLPLLKAFINIVSTSETIYKLTIMAMTMVIFRITVMIMTSTVPVIRS